MTRGKGCGRGRRRRRRCLPNGTVACIINMRRVFGKVSAGCVLNSVDPMSHCATPTLKNICNFKVTIAQHFAIFKAHFISQRYRNVPEPVTSFYLSAKTIAKCWENILHAGATKCRHSPSLFLFFCSPSLCPTCITFHAAADFMKNFIICKAIVRRSIKRKILLERCIDFCSF